MRKFIAIFISLILIFIMSHCPITVSAAQYPDTLRVGIYYASSTTSTVDFKSSEGFSIGASNSKDYYPFRTIKNTNITASKSPTGAYHVLYESYNNADEMNSRIDSLNNTGMSVFPAFYNSSYCVFGGNFTNQNDALWEAENSPIKGTPVAVSSTALQLKDSSTGQILFIMDIPSYGLAVYNANYYNADALLTISGSASGTYRGGFECKALSGDELTLVNIVPVESYLYSVVCREMSPSWHVEALKVQAVCARNFALSRINYHKQYGFDVCRTVCCQAYSTTADQSTNVHNAVDGTRGELLFHGFDLVQAVYSSSMGSTTESVEYVWGTPYPYLVSVDNSYEDTANINNGIWTKKLTKARATEIMNSKGYNLGNVTDIIALEYSPNGRVIKLCVKGTNGEKIFERESCRTVFSEATYSQKYTVSAGGITTPPTLCVTDKNGTKNISSSSLVALSGSNYSQAVSGTVVATDGKNTTVHRPTSSGGDPDTFVFSGEGWGHGVGMSQYGAKAMAEAGFGYQDILKHYYTGTNIQKAY